MSGTDDSIEAPGAVISDDEPATTREDGGGHRAAKRALELIEQVAASPSPPTLSALARSVGMPKSTAHLLARTLSDEGFLERDERGGYLLGPRLLALLGRLPAQFELPRVARPVMQALVDDLTETVLLGVARGASIVYIEQVEAPHFMRYVAPLGQARPLHCTSIGKVYLASLSDEEAAAKLRGIALDSYTVYTKTDLPAILAELGSIRQQGYALNREESVAGVTAVAAPVREGGREDGRFVAALSLVGPSERMRVELSDAPKRLIAAAQRIGAGVKTR